MFVTNLTNKKLGLNGRINLAAREVNRHIDNDDADLVARVLRLEAARLVSVVREPGLTKTGLTGRVVKTMGFDKDAVSSAPRTAGVEVKEPPKPATVVDVKPETKTSTKTTTRSTKRTSVTTQEKAKAETETSEIQE